MEVRHGRSSTRYGTWIDVSQEAVFAVALFLPVIVGAVLVFTDPWVSTLAKSAPVTRRSMQANRVATPRSTAAASPTLAPPTPVPALASQPIQAMSTTQMSAITPISVPPTITPSASTPTPLPVGRVANTSGDGVFLRHTPFLSDRWIAWPDKTPFILLGNETNSDGLQWIQVRDPKNNVGWVLAQYVTR